ncbi:hypothetical protein KQX54_016696 [Cotesia glomerata]|uniref:Uncharacterized protein n=1 Tax=Cotesia glomerata TaxID=32391 RepID=A0AAV7IRN6_COTGL|nr:hypothetical protein KQX54_016696 [Cotesia glomerata]
MMLISIGQILEEVQPTTNWTVARLKEWLNKEDIPYGENLRRKELYKLCVQHKKPTTYELDSLCEGTPHYILRSAPYCYFYNPIENVWGLSKRYYDAHLAFGGDYSEKKAVETWNEALARVTPQVWNECVKHTEKRILADYQRYFVEKGTIEIIDNLDPIDDDPELNDDNDSQSLSEMQTVSELDDDDEQNNENENYKPL